MTYENDIYSFIVELIFCVFMSITSLNPENEMSHNLMFSLKRRS